jgi:hypothetical protein
VNQVGHLGDRERGGDKVLVERRDPAGDERVVGIGGVVESDDDVRIEDDRLSSPKPFIISSQSRRTLSPSVLRNTPTCGFGRRGFCIAPASVRRMNSAFVRPSSAARRARASSRSGSR